jgi:hypothetical protein
MSLAADRLTGTWQLSCFAELTAVLPCHVSRCLLFFGMLVSSMIKVRIGPRRSTMRSTRGGPAYRLIGPIGLRHQVTQRLVGGLRPPGLDARGHRLDAFAVARHQQSRAI